ncbi:MAG: pilus assembly protein [Terracidiphilus sp.]|nr:pilus assembly protein [Terracidiphilus sp.]
MDVANEEGSTLVEVAVSFSLFAAVLLGIMQMSLALYAYHFVSDAAREASRWAMVRGSSCSANVSTANCSPTSGLSTGADNTDIQTYVNNLGYPYAGNLTTSTTWCTPSSSTPTTWTSCGTTSAYKGAGSQVQVTVSYSFPIAVPFWKSTTIPVSSTSSMVIAQ